MPYAGNQTMIVQLRTIVSGQLCYNTFEYGQENVGAYATPGTFLAAWQATFESLLLACMSDQAQLLSITVSSTAPTGVPPYAPAMAVVNSNGTEVSQVLPPYSSYRIYKQPDNDALEGSYGDGFRIGMIRVAGVPESFQTGGILTTGAATTVDAFASGIVALDVPPAGGGA